MGVEAAVQSAGEAEYSVGDAFPSEHASDGRLEAGGAYSSKVGPRHRSVRDCSCASVDGRRFLSLYLRPPPIPRNAAPHNRRYSIEYAWRRLEINRRADVFGPSGALSFVSTGRVIQSHSIPIVFWRVINRSMCECAKFPTALMMSTTNDVRDSSVEVLSTSARPTPDRVEVAQEPVFSAKTDSAAVLCCYCFGMVDIKQQLFRLANTDAIAIVDVGIKIFNFLQATN